MRNIKITPLPNRTIPIKVDVIVWQTLKDIKKENETFNDIIKGLLNQRTKSVGDEDIKAIRYKRKTAFFTLAYGKEIGIEFEYNDVKSERTDFTLDVKIKKVFFGRKIYTTSQFFGVDNDHKHFSDFFLEVYFHAVSLALIKEFKISVLHEPNQLPYWKQLYNDYNLSEESFKSDIEEPMRLSEDEEPSKTWKEKIDKSLGKKLIREEGIVFT